MPRGQGAQSHELELSSLNVPGAHFSHLVGELVVGVAVGELVVGVAVGGLVGASVGGFVCGPASIICLICSFFAPSHFGSAYLHTSSSGVFPFCVVYTLCE